MRRWRHEAHFADDAAVLQPFDDALADLNFRRSGIQNVEQAARLTFTEEVVASRDVLGFCVVGKEFDGQHGETPRL